MSQDRPSYLTSEDSDEFVQLADLVLHVPAADSGSGAALAKSLPLHSQVLARCCGAVAGMLASLKSPCCALEPLDITPFFFHGYSPAAPALLLFLRCAYSPEAVAQQLDDAAAAATGVGLEAAVTAVMGMLRLAHRLDAPRLLRGAVEWAHWRREEVYAADPIALLLLSEELHLEEMRSQVAAWLVASLAAGPAAAAKWLQRLDIGLLQPDTVAMLFDGLTSTLHSGGAPPAAPDLLCWGGPGSLCLAAAGRAADAQQAAQDAVFAAEWAAQHEQAEADWGAEFDAAEAAANEEVWGDEFQAGPDHGAAPAFEEGAGQGGQAEQVQEGEEDEVEAFQAVWQQVAAVVYVDAHDMAAAAVGNQAEPPPLPGADVLGGVVEM